MVIIGIGYYWSKCHGNNSDFSYLISFLLDKFTMSMYVSCSAKILSGTNSNSTGRGKNDISGWMLISSRRLKWNCTSSTANVMKYRITNKYIQINNLIKPVELAKPKNTFNAFYWRLIICNKFVQPMFCSVSQVAALNMLFCKLDKFLQTGVG